MQLLHQLLQADRYEYVLSVGRRKLALKHPKLIQLSGDMTQLEFWNYSELINEQSLGGEYHSLVENLENGNATIHAFSSLGTTIKQAGSEEKFFAVDHDLVLYFAKSVKKMGAIGFFYVSSMGANPSSNVFYSKVKGQTEEDLKSLDFDHLGIFRPSLLLGNRHEFRFGEKVATIVMKPLVWLKLFKNIRPIYDYQVAKAMVSVALDQNRNGIKIISSGEMQDLSK